LNLIMFLLSRYTLRNHILHLESNKNFKMNQKLKFSYIYIYIYIYIYNIRIDKSYHTQQPLCLFQNSQPLLNPGNLNQF